MKQILQLIFIIAFTQIYSKDPVKNYIDFTIILTVVLIITLMFLIIFLSK